MQGCRIYFPRTAIKAALYKRLKRRGTESEEVIKERIDKANREFKLAFKYDYIVINDEVRNAADRIMAIIRAEHAKTERSIHKYLELIENETDCNNWKDDLLWQKE